MTRLAHFLRGNKLRIEQVAEWSCIPEKKLREIERGRDFPYHFIYRLAGACSYLLGRRVEISELFEDIGERS